MGKEGPLARPAVILKYWCPVLLWMCFIFWMSTGTFSSENTSSVIGPVLLFLFPRISPREADLIQSAIRKCGHVVEYFILGLLLFRAFRCASSGSRTSRWTFPALLVLILYAAGDEFHQSFVASRTASLSDVGIDVGGGIIAQFTAAIRHTRRKASKPPVR